jgi:hypothetical protein
MQTLIVTAENKLQNLLNVSDVYIFLFNKNLNKLLRICNKQIKEFDLNSGIAGNSFCRSEKIIIQNGYNSSLFNGNIDIATHLPLIAQPIYHPFILNEKIGILEVINPKGIRPTISNKNTTKIIKNSSEMELLDLYCQILAQNIIRVIGLKKGEEKNDLLDLGVAIINERF